MSPYPHSEENQSRYKKTCYMQLFHSRFITAYCTCWFYKYNWQRTDVDTSQEDPEMAQRQRRNASVVHIYQVVRSKPKIGCLKFLPKMLNRSKISQVLPTKFFPMVVKFADSEKLSGFEIIETSQSFDRKNVCSSIVWNSFNIGLWEFFICSKSFRFDGRMIILLVFDLQIPLVIFSWSISLEGATRSLSPSLSSSLSNFFYLPYIFLVFSSFSTI